MAPWSRILSVLLIILAPGGLVVAAAYFLVRRALRKAPEELDFAPDHRRAPQLHRPPPGFFARRSLRKLARGGQPSLKLGSAGFIDT